LIPAKYYTALGLPHSANERDVKRAYRALVKMCHPDVNPSQDAHLKFLKITEAYEIITGQRPVPQARVRNTSAQASTKSQEQIQKERVERIRREKERQAKKEFLKQLKLHEEYVTGWRSTLFNFIFFTSLFCLVIITIDYNLPDKVTKHRVEHTEYMGKSTLHSMRYHRVYYDQNKRVEVIGGIGDNLYPNDIFYITRTKLMNEKREVLVKSGNYLYYAQINGSVFSILPIAYIFLILPLIARYVRKNIYAYASTYKLAVVATGLFLLYFFFDEMRILRILHLIN
jgi:hypothetical protein